MSGISDKAIKSRYAENKYRFNVGSELQNKEFNDGSGLEMYDAMHRMYDPQIGRFWQVDPLAEINESTSPYSFANNNPILLSDPSGDTSCENCMQEAVVTQANNRTGVGLADTKGGTSDVTAGPAPTAVTAPIGNGNSGESNTNVGAAGAAVIALGTIEEGGGVIITGTASIPVVVAGAIGYGLMKWAWPKGPISGPTQMPSPDIAIGVQTSAKLTTSRRFKLTRVRRLKLTTPRRSKLTT